MTELTIVKWDIKKKKKDYFEQIHVKSLILTLKLKICNDSVSSLFFVSVVGLYYIVNVVSLMLV